MGSNWKRRLVYVVCAVAVTVLGLASRHDGKHLPAFVAEYAGDTLWALMVFLIISSAIPQTRAFLRGGVAISLAYAVEVSQLYHAPWIDSIRQTLLGGLALGFDFVWTDLACYAIGVAIGVLLDYLVWGKSGENNHGVAKPA